LSLVNPGADIISIVISRITLALLLLMIAATAYAPPGLCPCWREPETHMHLPHVPARSEHDHHYLADLSETTGTSVIALPLLAAAAWVAITALGPIIFRLADICFQTAGLFLQPPTPPPRCWA
jgi:hypothetical protein